MGNYLGAMRRWVELANRGKDEYFYFVPNLHALTTRPEPKALAMDSIRDVAWLLAMGMDWHRATIFVHSQISAHAELTWILDSYVTMGELRRMTQYKEKEGKQGAEGQLVGLFNYPVLMAADILLYDVDEVPVGDDQSQHVELTRDIANRFNRAHGEVFKLPKATVQDIGARILDLQDPSKKMSKSDHDKSGCINLIDSPEEVKNKIKKAITDTGAEIKAGPSKPAITNLLEIYSLVTDKSVTDLEHQYQGVGYAQFKTDLADVLVEHLVPIRKEFHKLIEERDYLLSVLEAGRDKAAPIAEHKLAQVKAKVGLL